MFYKIVELATAKDVGETYVLVHFWETPQDFAKKPPVLINDFVMMLRPEGDVEGTIRQNILNYWLRAEGKGWRGDHSSSTDRVTQAFTENGRVLREVGTGVRQVIKRDKSDPHAILDRPGVKALENSTKEELPRPP